MNIQYVIDEDVRQLPLFYKVKEKYLSNKCDMCDGIGQQIAADHLHLGFNNLWELMVDK